MSENGVPQRYGFESFDCAPGLRLEASERLNALQFEGLSERIDRLEQAIERVERRLWLALYGVVAAILAEAFQPLLALM